MVFIKVKDNNSVKYLKFAKKDSSSKGNRFVFVTQYLNGKKVRSQGKESVSNAAGTLSFFKQFGFNAVKIDAKTYNKFK